MSWNQLNVVVRGLGGVHVCAVAEEESNMTRVLVEQLDGSCIELNLHPSWTIRVVKRMIEQQTGVPLLEQHLALVSMDEQMKDTMTVSGCAIQAGAKLLLTRVERPWQFDPAIIASIQAEIANNDANETALLSGLTDDEVAALETKFSFIFPPDLREWLQVGVPVHADTR
jgi:hypothetical protein